MGGIENHHLDGLIRGAVGSVAGLAAMGLVMRAAGRIMSDGESAGDAPDPLQRHDALDDIAIAGHQAREGEPATEAAGRLAYRAVAHHDPDEAMKEKLGTAIHWGYGILLGGAYGAFRNGAEGPDVLAGLGYGTAAWAIGDELMVPLLGLAEGPTAHPWSDHLLALGAHLAYGAATATATQALKRVM